MAFFYSFTDSLKQKWLQFYDSNRDWIKLHMEVDSVYTPDGGKRPSSYLILGVANALEPKLAQLMLPFSKLNPDADTLIEVLGLHFSPDAALGEQSMETLSAQESEELDSEFSVDGDEDKLNQVAAQISDSGEAEDFPDMELGNEQSENFVAEEGWGGQNLSNQASEASGFNDIAGGLGDIAVGEQESAQKESQAAPKMQSEDAFGDISFDEFKNGDTTGFGDALTDVWGEESAQKENEIFSGEDMSDSAIEDSEIARLFPNG